MPKISYWAGVLVLGLAIASTVLVSIVLEIDRNYLTDSPVTRADGRPLGTDFSAFYVGGRLFAEQRDALYDPETQLAVRQEVLGDVEGSTQQLPFVYPPLVAAGASLVASMPFRQAFWVWTVTGFVVSLTSLLVLARATGVSLALHRIVMVLLAIGFVPYSVNTFLHGQLSWLGVAVTALTIASLLWGRPFLAGLVFSLSYYKPPLFLLLLILLLVTQGRRFLAGFSVGAVLLVGLTFVSVGVNGVEDFLATATRYTYGQQLTFGFELSTDAGSGLVAPVYALLNSMTATLAVLFPFAVVTGLASRRLLRSPESEQRDLGLLLALTASLALSFQVLYYDLAILLPAMLLAFRWYPESDTWKERLVLVPLLAFYLEFMVRQFDLGRWIINGSSLLFLTLLVGLVWYAGTRYRSSGRSASLRRSGWAWKRVASADRAPRRTSP